MTLSRRDRAAMTLALHDLRATRIGGTLLPADVALPMALDTMLRADVPMRIRRCVFEAWSRNNMARLLRARLALALRALLRADRGDYGPRESLCVLCFGTTCSADDQNCISDGGCCPCHGATSARRYTALWSIAPTTNTAPRPAGLRRRTQEETR